MKTHKSESCSWRKKAEANPKELSSQLWYWHTKNVRVGKLISRA